MSFGGLGKLVSKGMGPFFLLKKNYYEKKNCGVSGSGVQGGGRLTNERPGTDHVI